MENTLEAYVDGSSLPRARRGGIGIVFVWIDEKTGEECTSPLSPPGYRQATSQEMEILACTTALRQSLGLELPGAVRRLIIRTDSDDVHKYHMKAFSDWPKQKWLGRSGRAIENATDWKELAKWYKKAKRRFEVIRIEWVRGHSKNPHNKAAHKLAQKSARNAVNKPRKVVHQGRKKTSETVIRGSVRMEGQRLTIRIFQTKPLEVQKLWRCYYEVVSPESPYCGKADVIITDWDKRLDRGHTYEVKVNEDNKNPRIVEVYREVVPSAEKEGGERSPS